LTFWSLVLLAIALTILLAGGLLAGRTAYDPTFSPPIFSRSAVSGDIKEPKMGRELVPAKSVPNLPGTDGAEGQELGYITTAKIRFADLEGWPVRATWDLRRLSVKKQRSRSSELSTTAVAPSSSGTQTLRAWIPAPSRSGRYVVELRLSNSGEALGRFHSEPFSAVGENCCHQYETATYLAAIPTGWKLRSDYVLASPHRYVSRLKGPKGMQVVIDTTLRERGDPLDDQRVLESLLAQGSERYQRLSVQRLTVRGSRLIEWSYRSGKDLYANELFYRGIDGYAILGSSSPSHFREVRDFVRRMAQSLRDYREG
jgi:hypothetical protein